MARKPVNLIFIAVLAVSFIAGVTSPASADQTPGEGSFTIYILNYDGWQLQGLLGFSDYEVLQLPLNNGDGQLKLRIVQRGHDAAFVDHVVLQKYGADYPPTSAVNIEDNADVLAKILNPEYDVCNAWGDTLEISWDSAPENATLVMRAMEEDLGNGHGVPLYYPPPCEQRTLGHTLVNDGGITADGLLEEHERPDFSVFWQPISPHPDGYTYGWLHGDSGYLYAAVEVTPDNTADADDWGALYITVDGKQREFRISEDQTWGARGFGYTSSVPYEHRIYEFKIPLSEISAAAGNEINYTFGAYGTVAGPCTSSVQCDDHNACTYDWCDTLAGGICYHRAIDCDDYNPCTADSCDPVSGCQHVPISGCCRSNAECNDGNLCTGDSCITGLNRCVFIPIPCGDNNPCTVDSCNPATGGCLHTPVDLLATATSNSTVCAGSVIQLAGGPAGMASYSWAGPNGFTSSGQNPTVSSSAAQGDAGTYVLTITSSSGCTDNATATVSIIDCSCPPPDTSFIASPTSGCAPLKVQFTNTTAENLSSGDIYWDFNGDKAWDVTGDPAPGYTYNTPGTYNVTLMTSNRCGSDNATATITVRNCRGGTSTGSGGWGKSANWQETDDVPQSSSSFSARPYIPAQLPNLVVQSASLSAGTTEPNLPVIVTALIGNIGTANGVKTVKVYVNGQEDMSTGVAVDPGQTRNMAFTISRGEPGTYSVYVDGTPAGSFEVRDNTGSTLVIIVSIMAVLIALAGLIYISGRRQNQY